METTKQAIGFAHKFYTLWTIETSPVYTTDVNGKHWLTGYDIKYFYHKNISFEIEKAKAAYPDLQIIEDLKGKTSSWTSTNKDDLCPQIMKFGKYYGKNIDELVNEDFQYVIWICENRGGTSNGKYANNLPQVINHFKSIEDAENKIILERENKLKQILEVGTLTFTPEKNLRIADGFAYISVDFGGIVITFKFDNYSYNEYNGFPYGLPVVNGKAKRMKGKLVTIEFEEDKNEMYSVIVKNITINKQLKTVI